MSRADTPQAFSRQEQYLHFTEFNKSKIINTLRNLLDPMPIFFFIEVRIIFLVMVLCGRFMLGKSFDFISAHFCFDWYLYFSLKTFFVKKVFLINLSEGPWRVGQIRH